MSDQARMPMTALMRGGGRLSAPAGADRGGTADQAVAKPLVKWAGGKRTLAPEISRQFPKMFNDYYEPFVGGGALFFHLISKNRINSNIFLSDINSELISTYMSARDCPDDLIEELRHHQDMHSKEHYQSIRKKRYRSDLKIAARFIYLNKTCFNGLYRVNKSGKFNVPMGSYNNPNICDEDNIRLVSRALEKVNLSHESFEEIKPKAGDLVYCDPPYDDTFTGYSGSGFGSLDQEILRDKCRDWCKKGVHVIVSNSNTEFIRKIYKDINFQIKKVKATRHISCDGSGRGKVEELIIIGRKFPQKSSRARIVTKKVTRRRAK